MSKLSITRRYFACKIRFATTDANCTWGKAQIHFDDKRTIHRRFIDDSSMIHRRVTLSLTSRPGAPAPGAVT